MSWRHPWRELVLAGGAMSAACGSSHARAADAAAKAGATSAPTGESDANPAEDAAGDASAVTLSLFPEASPPLEAASGPGLPDGSEEPIGIGSAFCCNDVPDPCCIMQCAREVDAAAYESCEHAYRACVDDGGFYQTQDDGSRRCTP